VFYFPPLAEGLLKVNPEQTQSTELIYKNTNNHTVKGARGKVLFDSQNDIYASQLSCDASPEVYIFVTSNLPNDKSASQQP
jgi:hypothetical protein